MRKILLITSLTLVVTPLSAEWVEVGPAAKRGETHYFDSDSIQDNGHFKKIWVLSSYEQKQTGGYQSVKSLYELDCQKEAARSHTLLLYPDSRAATSVIGAQHDQSKDWFGFAAGSFLDRIAKIICKE